MTNRWFFAIAAAFSLSTAIFAEVIDVTKDTFSAIIEQSEKPVILDIYAVWCPPCRRMAPIIDQASERYPEIFFAKINYDEQPELAKRFAVRQLPTILFILPGRSDPSIRSTGLLSDNALDEKIAEFKKMATSS